MKIAICDDESSFIRKLSGLIADVVPNGRELDEFSSGDDLLADFHCGKYEVIILDVEMPGINGLETAQRIRSEDKSVIISFLTNYAEFAVQGYEVEAFRYILKNQPDYVIRKQLESIFDECTQRFKTYSFSKQNMTVKFKLSDIRYFEVHGRKVTINTLNESIDFYGKFSEICQELQPYNFIVINRGILINPQHISKIVKSDAVMSNGVALSIGRTYKNDVISKYLDFTARR